MSTEHYRILPDGAKRTLTLDGHVGFDSLPDQLVNKAVSKGFDFNILCVGETGIGKSTLMDCLFQKAFEDKPTTHKLPNVSLESSTYTLKEGTVTLRLTLIDTMGFGDQIGRADSHAPIVDYIDDQFEKYLQEELKIQRDMHSFHDTRVHLCLYFLPPTGHSLKSIDLACMKELMHKVNIVPIIAKSDTIGKADLTKFKSRIMEEIHENTVDIYSFPIDDQPVAELNAKMNKHVPFAVVGSRESAEVNKKTVRARCYPWGTVEVENEGHCDFVKLREMVLRENMEDLREKTQSMHYERYRRAKLAEMGFAQRDETDQPVRLSELIEKRRHQHLQQMQAREDEMRQMFVNKVKDKEAELKQSEQDLHVKFESLKRTHAEEKRKLEDRRRILEEEMNKFNKLKAETQAAQAQAARDMAQGNSVGSPGSPKSGKRRK